MPMKLVTRYLKFAVGVGFLGGFHDVFPILLALIPNGVIYSIVVLVICVMWTRARHGEAEMIAGKQLPRKKGIDCWARVTE